MPLKSPKRTETLVQKTEKRSRRLILKNKFIGFVPHWWLGTREFFALVFLFAINFWLLHPFFGQEHQFNSFSAPLIPLLADLTTLLIPYSYGLRLWLLVFIIPFPIIFYFFVREISRLKLTAFLAALVSSLPISVFLFLRAELGLLVDDGGQVASLTITCLVCLFLLKFIREGNFKMLIFTSIGIALVALTSPLGLFILVCFSMAITFSEMLLSRGRLKLARFLIVFLFAAGYVAFWYNPKFVFLIFNSFQGELLIKTLLRLLPVSFFLVPVLGAFGFLLFESRPHLQPLFLACFLSIGFGLLSLGAGVDLSVPSRFQVAFGISLAFLLGVLLTKLLTVLVQSRLLLKYPLLYKYQSYLLPISVYLLTLIALMIILFFSQKLKSVSQEKVLVIATINKIGLWEIREQSKGIFAILGNVISLVMLGLTFFIAKKVNPAPGSVTPRRSGIKEK